MQLGNQERRFSELSLAPRPSLPEKVSPAGLWALSSGGFTKCSFWGGLNLECTHCDLWALVFNQVVWCVEFYYIYIYLMGIEKAVWEVVLQIVFILNYLNYSNFTRRSGLPGSCAVCCSPQVCVAVWGSN